tara:strand:+ start:2211 stop:2414 length:204 start_codon:yes stop_codon:yes gene_type:complete
MTPAVRLIFLPLGDHTVVIAQADTKEHPHCTVSLKDPNGNLVDQTSVTNSIDLADALKRMEILIGEP